jgi:hypothetical protein
VVISFGGGGGEAHCETATAPSQCGLLGAQRGQEAVQKLNHGHYKKLRLLVAASCRGSIGKDLHQRAGTGGTIRGSESDFYKRVYCVLSRYHLVLDHGFQMALQFNWCAKACLEFKKFQDM